ncbi:conserved hypothetical protein CHP02452 [Kipferlia bialata]|uniref:Microbial-type PARG catalytic domain-containing protein n=1 Tax=Kipferlia bialata TaxID=797122 RepID=A0A9K3GEL7_9EUKA|nr:conserved hypothetical protein CHP02452 [Kipferlia bialata]|eukprot:g2011.t1
MDPDPKPNPPNPIRAMIDRLVGGAPVTGGAPASCLTSSTVSDQIPNGAGEVQCPQHNTSRSDPRPALPTDAILDCGVSVETERHAARGIPSHDMPLAPAHRSIDPSVGRCLDPSGPFSSVSPAPAATTEVGCPVETNLLSSETGTEDADNPMLGDQPLDTDTPLVTYSPLSYDHQDPGVPDVEYESAHLSTATPSVPTPSDIHTEDGAGGADGGDVDMLMGDHSQSPSHWGCSSPSTTPRPLPQAVGDDRGRERVREREREGVADRDIEEERERREWEHEQAAHHAHLLSDGERAADMEIEGEEERERREWEEEQAALREAELMRERERQREEEERKRAEWEAEKQRRREEEARLAMEREREAAKQREWERQRQEQERENREREEERLRLQEERDAAWEREKARRRQVREDRRRREAEERKRLEEEQDRREREQWEREQAGLVQPIQSNPSPARLPLPGTAQLPLSTHGHAPGGPYQYPRTDSDQSAYHHPLSDRERYPSSSPDQASQEPLSQPAVPQYPQPIAPLQTPQYSWDHQVGKDAATPLQDMPPQDHSRHQSQDQYWPQDQGQGKPGVGPDYHVAPSQREQSPALPPPLMQLDNTYPLESKAASSLRRQFRGKGDIVYYESLGVLVAIDIPQDRLKPVHSSPPPWVRKAVKGPQLSYKWVPLEPRCYLTIDVNITATTEDLEKALVGAVEDLGDCNLRVSTVSREEHVAMSVTPRHQMLGLSGRYKVYILTTDATEAAVSALDDLVTSDGFEAEVGGTDATLRVYPHWERFHVKGLSESACGAHPPPAVVSDTLDDMLLEVERRVRGVKEVKTRQMAIPDISHFHHDPVLPSAAYFVVTNKTTAAVLRQSQFKSETAKAMQRLPVGSNVLSVSPRPITYHVLLVNTTHTNITPSLSDSACGALEGEVLRAVAEHEVLGVPCAEEYLSVETHGRDFVLYYTNSDDYSRINYMVLAEHDVSVTIGGDVYRAQMPATLSSAPMARLPEPDVLSTLSAVSRVSRETVQHKGWDERSMPPKVDLTDEHRVFVQAHTLARVKEGVYAVKGKSHRIPKVGTTTAYSAVRLFKRPSPEYLRRPHRNTCVDVVNVDSVTAGVAQTARGKKVAVLNFANERRPGGGYLHGRSAQEEELFRRTNYVMSLDPSQVNHGAEAPVQYPWHSPAAAQMDGEARCTDVVVSEDVTVIRKGSEDGYAMMPPVTLTMIATAAPDKPDTRPSGTGAQVYADPKQAATLIARVHGVLRAAVYHKVDRLILGALGCGAFRNPPAEVVSVFEALLPTYLPYFERVTFAVLGDDNYDAFAPLRSVSPVPIKRANMRPVCREFHSLNTEEGGGFCPSCRDADHAKRFWHPRVCKSADGRKCPQNDSAVHMALYMHKRPCPEWERCRDCSRRAREDENNVHCALYSHPDFCDGGARCQDFTPEHCREWWHPATCNDGVDCMDTDEIHLMRFRHPRRDTACNFGAVCCDLSASHRHVCSHPVNIINPDPFAAPLYPSRKDSGVSACPHGWLCTKLQAYLGGSKARDVMRHIKESLHLPRAQCDPRRCPMNVPKIDPAAVEQHLWEFSHKDIPDIRLMCRNRSACRRRGDLSHIQKYCHAPELLPVSQFIERRDVDFRANHCYVRGQIREKRGNEGLRQLVDSFLPTHRLNASKLELVLATGYFMSLRNMERLGDPWFLADTAKLNPVVHTFQASHQTVVAEFLHAHTIAAHAKKAGTPVTRTVEDTLKECRMNLAVIDKKAIKHLEKVSTRIVEAAASLDADPEKGIGYDVDKAINTDDTVFTNVGPNTFNRYGEIHVTFRQSLMRHPNSYLHWSAGTLYVTQPSLPLRGHVHLPGDGRASAPFSPERLENYRRSRLSLAEAGTSQLLADDLHAILSHEHGPVNPEQAMRRWTGDSHWNSHYVLEGHLPPTVGLGYIHSITMDKATHKGLSPTTKEALKDLQCHLVLTDKPITDPESAAEAYRQSCLGVPMPPGYQFTMSGAKVSIPTTLHLDRLSGDRRAYIRFSCIGDVLLQIAPRDAVEGDPCRTLRFTESRVEITRNYIAVARQDRQSGLSAMYMSHPSLDAVSYRSYVVTVSRSSLEVRRVGHQKQTVMQPLEETDSHLFSRKDHIVTFATVSVPDLASISGCVITNNRREISYVEPIREEDPCVRRARERGSAVHRRVHGHTSGPRVPGALPVCQYAACCRLAHLDRDPTHIAKYRHVCPLGPVCPERTNPTHVRQFIHATRPVCNLGIRCPDIGDRTHRLSHHHPGTFEFYGKTRRIPDVPYACSKGESCGGKRYAGHLAEFSHWPLDRHVPECPMEDDVPVPASEGTGRGQRGHGGDSKRLVCKHGLKCKHLGDRDHRVKYHHPGTFEYRGRERHIADNPVPCKDGPSCKGIGFPAHLAEFSHWPLTPTTSAQPDIVEPQGYDGGISAVASHVPYTPPRIEPSTQGPRSVCTLGLECPKLGDRTHRETHTHPATFQHNGRERRIRDDPIVCKHGKKCRGLKYPGHLAEYSHWGSGPAAPKARYKTKPQPREREEREREHGPTNPPPIVTNEPVKLYGSYTGGFDVPSLAPTYSGGDTMCVSSVGRDNVKREREPRKRERETPTYGAGRHVSSYITAASHASAGYAPGDRDLSVCFVMDVTGSMGSYITATAKQVVKMAQELQKYCENKGSGDGYRHAVKAFFSYVGYRDIRDSKAVEVCDFGPIPTLQSFVQGMRPTGGADVPEDIATGLDAALNFRWGKGHRMVVVLADAPNHGKGFMHTVHRDDYPEADQHGVAWSDRLDAIIRASDPLDMNYVFVPVGSLTGVLDPMVDYFKGHLKGGRGRVHKLHLASAGEGMLSLIRQVLQKSYDSFLTNL